MTSAIYTPPPELRTYLDNIKDDLSKSFKVNLATYHDVHEFSVSRPNDFWMALWHFLDIRASVHPSKISVDQDVPIDQFPQFFEDSRLNFAENMLARTGPAIAVKSFNEDTSHLPQSVSWDELAEMVRTLADAMKSSGICQGDVIVGVGSNSATFLALLLATAAIGGIFASFASDMGEKALYDRLSQLHPRLVFFQTSYKYNAKSYNIIEKTLRVFSNIDKPKDAELVAYTEKGTGTQLTTSFTSHLVPWEDFIAREKGRNLVFTQIPFNTPLVVMFSSGTSGTPKGIVHSHGGLIINGKKEHRLHNNFDSKDVYFHFTNIGWTLWNIAIGSLMCGSTLVLYDGSPFYPSPNDFLEIVFSTGITAFGAGPRYFSELRIAQVNPRDFTKKLDLLVSTGAVLTSSLSIWMAHTFGPVCQISMSGGTELCGSFVHGIRTLPTYPGEITVKALGLDVDVFSLDGESKAPGEIGELVCKKPFPNMPACFLNDLGKQRYFETYFDKIPHVWAHGDLIRIEKQTKGLVILGRSDGVLNPSGVRFGSSEIYSTLAAHFPMVILDSLCAGQQQFNLDNSEKVFLFLKLSPAASGKLISSLDQQIRQKITQDLSRRHVPQYIVEIDTIPYNANGKKLEAQVKAVLNGGDAALQKIRATEEEKIALRPFVKFFEVEKLTGRSGVDSKL